MFNEDYVYSYIQRALEQLREYEEKDTTVSEEWTCKMVSTDCRVLNFIAEKLGL